MMKINFPYKNIVQNQFQKKSGKYDEDQLFIP